MARNLYKASFAIGHRAENTFEALAQRKGWTTLRATPAQDMREHWDLQISKARDGKSDLVLKVDVKAMKRQSRSDSQVQSDWTWIELSGVNMGNEGWLYGGMADLLAFQRESDFLLVSRQDVIETVERLVDPSLPKVSNAREAKYRVYNRAGRHDMITMIETSHLLLCAWKVWKYNE